MANEYWVSSAAAGGGTGAIGDPLTIAEACSSANRGIYYIEADGTYTTATTLTTSGSYKHFVGANSSGVVDGSMPVIQASATIAGPVISQTGSNGSLVFLDVDGNSEADEAIRITSTSPCVSCIARRAKNYGIHQSVSGGVVSYCLAHSNTVGDGIGIRLNLGSAYRCVSRDNTTGITAQNAPSSAYQCVASGNSGNGFTSVITVDCVSHDNGASGYNSFGPTFNCLASSNGTLGWNNSFGVAFFSAYGSGAAANTTGAYPTWADGDDLPTGVDAGAAPYRDSADTPPDYRIASSSALDGVGVWWAESIFGSTDDRPGIGIGDFEPASGGGSSGSPLTSPFLRV
jgi:hypothetical protein